MSFAKLRYELVFILSWLSLLIERFWASFWPAISVLFAFFGLAALRFFTVFGNEAHIGLLFAFTALFYIALMRFGAPFHMPNAKEVRRAIERESDLLHRPLEALEDKPVTGTPKDTALLWQRYQERLKKLWTKTKVHRPRPGVARHDPYSLRFAALLILVVGFGIAQAEAPYRIKNALSPSFKHYFKSKTATLDVWITPPDYTRQNPAFLATTQLGAAPTQGAIAVPENSVLKVRISGYDDAPKFKYGEKEYPLATSGKNHTLEMPLTESGHLRISRWFFVKLGDWPVTVIDDKPPGIVLLKHEKTRRDQVKLTYTAKDDYRVTDVSGSIAPGAELAKALGAKASRTIDFEIPSPETGEDEKVHTADLTWHPWAGSEVVLKLMARDDVGQVGESDATKIVLPEREFHNPVARAIIFQRKQLIWYNNMLTRPVVAQKLFETGARPDNYKYDKLVYLGLNMAYKRLLFDGSNEDSVDSVISLLWDLAIRVEDGGLALAQRELSDALQKLAEKLRDKNATKEEIEELMQKVREKSREYAKNLAQETQQRMQGKQQNEKISQELIDKIMRQLDTEKLMKEMEELTQGSEREQMEKMAEYMKRNIDRLDHKKMEEMEQKYNKTLKSLDDLQKLIERQQKLMDQTNKMLPPKDRMEPEKTHEQQQQEEQQKEEQQKGSRNEQQKQQESQQQGQQGQQQQQGETSQQQQQGQSGQPQQQQGQQQGEQGQQQQTRQQGQQGQQQQGQSGQPQPGQNGQQGQQSGQQGEGGMMDKLQDAVKRAAEQAGKTSQQQPGQGQQGQPVGPPQPKPDGTGGFTSADDKEKQRRQEQGGKEGDKDKPSIRTTGEGATEQGGIREGLGDVMRRLGESMKDVPKNFGAADQEMKAARKEFREEDAKGSLPHQKEALDQMNEGMDQATKQIADQITETIVNFGVPQKPGEGGYGEGFDPLGRNQQGDGGNGDDQGGRSPSTGYVKIPDEKERRRVQEIIDELRTRSNDYTRPKSERDYINRLLNQFE